MTLWMKWNNIMKRWHDPIRSLFLKPAVVSTEVGEQAVQDLFQLSDCCGPRSAVQSGTLTGTTLARQQAYFECCRQCCIVPMETFPTGISRPFPRGEWTVVEWGVMDTVGSWGLFPANVAIDTGIEPCYAVYWGILTMGDRDRAMLCSQLRNSVGEIIFKKLSLQFLFVCFLFHFFLLPLVWCTCL